MSREAKCVVTGYNSEKQSLQLFIALHGFKNSCSFSVLFSQGIIKVQRNQKNKCNLSILQGVHIYSNDNSSHFIHYDFSMAVFIRSLTRSPNLDFDDTPATAGEAPRLDARILAVAVCVDGGGVVVLVVDVPSGVETAVAFLLLFGGVDGAVGRLPLVMTDPSLVLSPLSRAFLLILFNVGMSIVDESMPTNLTTPPLAEFNGSLNTMPG